MSDGSVIINLKLATDNFKQDMDNVSKSLSSLGDKFTGIGKSLTLGITTPLTAMGGLAIKTFTSFDDSMRQVKSTMNSTDEEFNMLATAAKDMGASTAFSASQAAEALNFLALAGYDVDRAINTLPKVLNLASAGGMELAYASDMVTDSMASLGLAEKDLDFFMDQMTKTSQKSNTSISQLGNAILTVGGTARTLKGGVTEMNTVLGILADNGIKGSEGGTALRNMILSLSGPTDKATDIFKALGIELADDEGNLRALNEVFAELNESLDGMGTATKASILSDVFNKVDLKSVNALMENCTERFTELSEEIINSAGATDTAAAIMEEGIGGSFRSFKSAIEGLNIAFAEVFAPSIQAATNHVTGLITQLIRFAETNPHIVEMIGKFGLLAAAIGPVSLATGTLINITSKLGTSFVNVINIGGKLLVMFSSCFTIPTLILGITAAIIALTVAAAEFTSVGDNAYIVLAVLAGAFTALAATAVVIGVIEGIKVALAGQALVANASTISVVAYNAANKALAVTSAIASAAIGLTNGTFVASAVSATAAVPPITMFGVALNAAILPITLLVAAVGAVTAAIAFYVINTNKLGDETKAVIKETNNLIDAQQELADTLESGNKAYEDRTTEIKENTSCATKLANEVLKLSAEYEKNGEGLELLEAKISLLNSAVPELNLAIDEETKSLDMSTSAILDKISAQESQLSLASMLAEQQRLLEAEAQIETRLLEIQKARLDIEEKLNNSTNLKHSETKALNEQLQKLNQTEEEYNSSLADNTEKYKALNPKIEQASKLVKEAESANLLESESIKKVSLSLEEQEEQRKKNEETLQKYTAMTTNALKKIEVAEQKNANGTTKTQEQIRNELLDTMKVNQEIVDGWTTNLVIVEQMGLDPQFVKDLRNAGPESAKLVEALVSASESEIQELNNVFENGSKVAIDALKREMGLDDTINAGSNMIDEIANATAENKALEVAVTTQVDQAKETMVNQVATADFKAVGSDMSAGVVVGMENGTNMVSAAAAKLVTRALESMRNTADTHSPSKETIDIAHDIGDGLIVGTEDKEDEVAESAEDLAHAFLDPLADEFEIGLQGAKAIMLGEWQDIHQGMAEVVKQSGAEVIQAEYDVLDEEIKAIEKRNSEIAKEEELASKKRAIAKAKTSEERLKAQKEYDDALAKQELDSLKERRDNVKAMLTEIANAYNDMGNAITSALKTQYTEQRDIEKQRLSEEVTRRKAVADENYKNLKNALDDEISLMKEKAKEMHDTQKENLQNAYNANKESLETRYSAEVEYLDKSYNAQKESAKASYEYQKETTQNLYNLQKESIANEIQNVKDGTKEMIAEYKNAYESKLLYLNTEESNEIAELQQQINALDEMTNAEERALKTQREQEKLHALEQKIIQATSSEEKLKAQEEYNIELAKQQREALLQQRKDEQASLKEQIAEIKANYKTQKELEKESYDVKKEQAEQNQALKLQELENESANLKLEYDNQLKILSTAYEAQNKISEENYKHSKQMLADNLKTQKDLLERNYKDELNELNRNYAMQQKLDDEYAKNKKANLETTYADIKDSIEKFNKETSANIEDNYKSLTSKERLAAEARKMMIDDDQQAIIDLLNQYTPDWATAGQNMGQAFLNALQGTTPSIESEVQRIMDLVRQANNIGGGSSSGGLSGSTSRGFSNFGNGGVVQVSSGDTLGNVANVNGVALYGVSSKNTSSLEDDRKLRAGSKLKLPILHNGGVSQKEQLALIDSQEAVIPLVDLAKIMQSVVLSTADRLIDGFSHKLQNSSNVITNNNNNDNGVTINLDYTGEMTRYDVDTISRELATQTSRAMRGRGIPCIN